MGWLACGREFGSRCRVRRGESGEGGCAGATRHTAGRQWGPDVDDALLSYMAEVDRTIDQRAFEDGLKNYMREQGFDLFTYLELHPSEGPYNSYRISTYPSVWINRYVEKSYREIDPAVLNAKRRLDALVWPLPEFDGVSTERLSEFYSEAAQFGIQSGFSVPIHGPGSVSALLVAATDASRGEVQNTLRRQLHVWRMVLATVFVASMRFRQRKPNDVALSPRETECLLWTARGKTAREIGMILSIAERTVVQHLTNACRKFDVYSKHLAVVKAISMGLIVP